MFNQGVEVTFKGNLTREPEMRYLADGTAVTNISVAANRSWNDPTTGEKKQDTTWVRCSVWGKMAEPANQYLVRGQQVIVRGRLQSDPQTGHPRLYQRSDGTMAASFEVRVFNLDYGPKPKGHDDSAAVNGVETVEMMAEDIPF